MLIGVIAEPRRIELQETHVPNLDNAGPGKILFRPEVACLCGSDRPYFLGEHTPYPLAPGLSLHEMVGTVAATTGKRFQAGDRVLAVPVDHFGLAEEFVLDEGRAIPLDPRVEPEHGVLAQPLGTVIYALKKIPTWLDQDVLILGQGPIGQMFVAAVHNLGARRIVVYDPIKDRTELSRKMGATDVLPHDADPETSLRKIVGERGVDVVVEAAGHENYAFNLAVSCIRREGRILSFGVPHQSVDGLNMHAALLKNAIVQFSVHPDFQRDFPLAMQWLAEGRMDLRPLISHRYNLDKLQTAFTTFCDRQDHAMKVMVNFPAGKAAGVV